MYDGEIVWNDLRLAIRTILKRPGFFVLAVTILALGSGANLAIFSIANAVMLAPLPYHEPANLVSIWEANLAEGKDHERVAPPNFADYHAVDGVFEDVSAWWHFDVNLTDNNAASLRVAAVECTSNFFSLLGVAPQIGAGFAVEGRLYDPVLEAVISDRLWRQRYRADPDIVGKSISLNGSTYTVAGVMKVGFRFPGEVDIWQRQSWDPSVRTRFAHFLEAIGRLHDGVELQQAQTELTALSKRLGEDYPASNNQWQARLVPLHQEVVGKFGPALSTLMVAVGLLLLLATANVANLLLARGLDRRRELATRAAVGATPWRLLRYLMIEQLLICLCATAVGGGLAAGLVRLLLATKPVEIPRLSEVSFNTPLLIFGLGLVGVTLLLLGALPAVQVLRTNLQSILKQTTHSGRTSRRNHSVLVIAEVAIAMTLLVGAGLLIRDFQRLLAVPTGFEAEEVVTMSLELPAALYPDWTQVSQFYSELLRKLDLRPEISRLGVTSFLPFDPAWIVGYSVPDRPPRVAGESLRAQYVTTGPGYFQTLGVPLLVGRMFDSRDTADSLPVVLVNEELASRIGAHPADAVGTTLKAGTRGFGPLGRSISESGLYEIVGVVADLKNNGLEGDADPALYFVYRQFPYRTLSIVVSSQAEIGNIVALVRNEVSQLDPALPIARVRTLEQLVGARTARSRFVMSLMTGFALLALVLVATGVYGVLSYQVQQQRHEIAMRLSLGALPDDVQNRVLWQSMALVGAGLVLGSLLTIVLGQWLSTLVFGASIKDGTTMAVAAAVITFAALAACYPPARRAARTNPMEVLRTG